VTYISNFYPAGWGKTSLFPDVLSIFYSFLDSNSKNAV
jgi:hypothetical protein